MKGLAVSRRYRISTRARGQNKKHQCNSLFYLFRCASAKKRDKDLCVGCIGTQVRALVANKPGNALIREWSAFCLAAVSFPKLNYWTASCGQLLQLTAARRG
jgi:hypothetical protein